MIPQPFMYNFFSFSIHLYPPNFWGSHLFFWLLQTHFLRVWLYPDVLLLVLTIIVIYFIPVIVTSDSVATLLIGHSYLQQWDTHLPAAKGNTGSRQKVAFSGLEPVPGISSRNTAVPLWWTSPEVQHFLHGHAGPYECDTLQGLPEVVGSHLKIRMKNLHRECK